MDRHGSLSPICSLYASYLKHKVQSMEVCHLVEQILIILKMKKLCTTNSYQGPSESQEYELRMIELSGIIRNILIWYQLSSKKNYWENYFISSQKK